MAIYPKHLCLALFREETHEQAEEEEGEDLVSKAEAEFFKIVEAEKKALEEAENKRNAALAEVKQAIAQEGVTHEEYQEGGSEPEKKSDEVTALSSFLVSLQYLFCIPAIQTVGKCFLSCTFSWNGWLKTACGIVEPPLIDTFLRRTPLLSSNTVDIAATYIHCVFNLA